MQPLDAHREAVAALKVDGDHALADDRLLVLRDLIALRQVRVEIVLPLETALQVDLRLEAQARAHGLRHAFAIEHRQHAGHGGIDQADMGIGRAAEGGGGAGEQL